MNDSSTAERARFPEGTVYGALLNDRATIERLASAFQALPYKAPPVAPVLYIKPRNTVVPDGSSVAVPSDPGKVRIDATLGAVIGRRACRLSEGEAMQYVRGLVIVSDLTLPHEIYYRPAIRQRCRDGFCPMSGEYPVADLDLANATMTVSVNGTRVHSRSFAQLVRPLPRLLADVTEFITLEAGDVLLLGPPEGAPVAQPGDSVELDVPGLGSLSHDLVVEVLKEVP